MEAWMVRAGRDGERENFCLENGVVAISWSESGDLAQFSDRADLQAALKLSFPKSGTARVSNWTGQLWRFANEIQVGDHVVMPLKRSRQVAVGRIEGEYRFEPTTPQDAPHLRSVKWREKNVDRDDISRDLLDSLGSLLTVCNLSRSNASERVERLFLEGTDPGGPGGTVSLGDEQQLMAQAAARSAGDPLLLTVRELLDHWGATRRTADTIERINEDLTNEGLVSDPPFSEGWIGSKIRLLTVGQEPAADKDDGEDIAAETDEPDTSPTITQQIGALRAANQVVVSVRDDADLRVATTEMLRKKFSQLAVVDDDGVFQGSVTWESVAQAMQHGKYPKVGDALVTVGTVRKTKVLSEVIDEISKIGYVFVEDGRGRATGIVTSADLTTLLGKQMHPFVTLEEIERRLRGAVNKHFTLKEMASVVLKHKRNKVKGAESFTFGDYLHLFKNPEWFDRLGWTLLTHDVFLKELNEARITRNDLMHFALDEFDEVKRERLEAFLDMIRGADSRR